MADYFTICTAFQRVPCTVEEAAELRALLNVTDQEGDPSDNPEHDLEIEWDVNGAYLVTDYGNSSVDALPEAFLVRFGELIGRAGMPYLQIGMAFTCSKYRVGSHGGEHCRIYPNGDLVFPEEVWPVRPI